MDKSVIICEEVSPAVKTPRRPGLRKRNSERVVENLQVMCKRQTYYESPLKHLRSSRVRSTAVSTPTLTRKNEKSTQQRKKKNPAKTNSKHEANPVISGDSIIVVSDSEIESNSTSTSINLKNCKEESVPSQNSSCLLISDTDDADLLHTSNVFTKERNKSQRQSQDDVVVVWSSVPKIQDDDPSSFLIDKKPNRRNCKILGENHTNPISLAPQSKKRKKRVKNTPNGPGFQAKRPKHNKNKHNTLTENTQKPVVKDKDIEYPLGRLREIIIDGCNVATIPGKLFSEDRIKLVIDYFKNRGHSVKVFVPQHKRSHSRPLLEKLFTEGIVVFTPSREIEGRHITPYDDRYILEYATLCGGIVVSSDQYRDLYKENPEWRDTILNRLLQPTFVGNCVLFPQDPLGRRGPTLDQFLRHQS